MIRDCLWQIAVGAIVLALIAMPLTIVVRTLALLD
jgi:hypothetical protein